MKNQMMKRWKELVSGALAAVMVLLLLPAFCMDAAAAEEDRKFVSVGDNGCENCVLAMDTIKVTQGLHSGDSIDLGGADTGCDWMYAPVTCRVTYVYTAGINTVFFESVDKVNLPGYEEPQYIKFLAMHMEDLSGFKVGDVYAQGARLYKEGNQGLRSRGNHIHFSVGLGRAKTGRADWYEDANGDWVLRNHIPVNKAMFLPKASLCEVARAGGLKWTQIKDYTEEPCALMATVTKVNSTKTAPLHNYPEAAGAVTSRLKKNQSLFLTAKVTNAGGNSWYRTASGEFIYAKYVTVDKATSGGIVLANQTFRNGSACSFVCGGKILYASGTANGDPLKMSSSAGGKTAQFKLNQENGYWVASSKAKSSAVINAYSDNPTPGCPATMYKKLTTPTQGLVFQRAEFFGTGYVIRLASNPALALTVKGSSLQFVTYDKNNSNQVWTMVKCS